MWFKYAQAIYFIKTSELFFYENKNFLVGVEK